MQNPDSPTTGEQISHLESVGQVMHDNGGGKAVERFVERVIDDVRGSRSFGVAAFYDRGIFQDKTVSQGQDDEAEQEVA